MNKYVTVILIIVSVIVLFPRTASAQNETVINLPNYDTRFLRYGFLIGIHRSNYELRYSDTWLDSVNIHSIQPQNSFGFTLGFIVNAHLAEHFDIRFLPSVGFYEHMVEYNYLNRPQEIQNVEATNIELPILLKYKSQRRGNVRMYVIGGTKFSIEASGKKEEDGVEDGLFTKSNNISIEAGFGFDMYFPLFKFSPEIRYSRGISNVLQPRVNRFTTSIDRLTNNSITLYLLFE